MSRNRLVRSVQGTLFAAAILLLASQAATAQWRSNCRGYQPPCQPCQPYHPHQPSHAPRQPGDLPEIEPKDGKQKADDRRDDDRPDQAQQAPQDVDTSPSVAQAGGYTASNSTILGRVDQNNRLNLFDSMSALPMNRWWVTYMPMKRYHNPVEFLSESVDSDLLPLEQERLSQTLYRFGAELIVHPGVSVAFQGQYSVINGNEGGYDDVFTNPQIMLKAVLACDCCSIVSATLGFQPEVDTEAEFGFSRTESLVLLDAPGINETSSRVYPGLLCFHDLGLGWFMQNGVQVGIPTESNQITTLDWAVSFGNWIYRHPMLNCSSRCCHCCCQPSILGAIAQVEFFGKHVLGDNRIENVFGVPGLIFEEDRNVVDMTAGVQVLMSGSHWLSVAASIPLTSGDVREVEGIVTLGQRW